MKNFVRAIALFFAIIVQTTIIADIRIFGVVSSLFLAVLLYTVSVSDMPWAIGYGAVCGALLDLLCAKVFGVHTLLCLFFSIAVSFIGNGVRAKKLPYYLIATFLFTGLYEYFASVFYMAGGTVTLRWGFLHKVLPATVANTLWMLPIYWIFTHRPLKKYYEERSVSK